MRADRSTAGTTRAPAPFERVFGALAGEDPQPEVEDRDWPGVDDDEPAAPAR